MNWPTICFYSTVFIIMVVFSEIIGRYFETYFLHARMIKTAQEGAIKLAIRKLQWIKTDLVLSETLCVERHRSDFFGNFDFVIDHAKGKYYISIFCYTPKVNDDDYEIDDEVYSICQEETLETAKAVCQRLLQAFVMDNIDRREDAL